FERSEQHLLSIRETQELYDFIDGKQLVLCHGVVSPSKRRMLLLESFRILIISFFSKSASPQDDIWIEQWWIKIPQYALPFYVTYH
ncbi:hypothetical protein ACLOJK_009645, partial [Asimina triloba]